MEFPPPPKETIIPAVSAQVPVSVCVMRTVELCVGQESGDTIRIAIQK